MIRARRIPAPDDATSGGKFPFVMFCIFMISYFLHLTQRLPALGAIRFDLLLGAATFISALMNRPKPAAGEAQGFTPIGKWLLIVIGYMFVSLPFVEWPGSVLNKGLEPFLKAVCFYFFVTSTVNTIGRLKTLTAIFVACQAFRIIEPLYMHMTTG